MKKTFTIAKVGIPDSSGDIIMPGAVKSTKSIPITRNFDNSLPPIGIASEVQEVGSELKATGDFNTDYLPYTAAIGFQVIKSEVNDKGQRVIQELKLHEISLVSPDRNPDIPPILNPGKPLK